jgi:hypothetical protein
MKKSDLIVIMAVVILLLPFFLFPPVLDFYRSFNASHAYLASFIKFAILATFGESIGLRIRKGIWSEPGFGFLPRALVWGIIGIWIKMAFVIFGEGAPVMMKTLGVHFPPGNPADLLREGPFTWYKFLAAFSVGFTINIFFAPVFMTFHKLTDLHISNTGGTLRGFFTPIPMGRYLQTMDWNTMWSFVLKKTLVWFWIPAQTLNFLLPEEWRILVAAVLSVVLGVLLSVASIVQKKS